MRGYSFFNWIMMNILEIKLLGFAKNVFFIPASVVST